MVWTASSFLLHLKDLTDSADSIIFPHFPKFTGGLRLCGKSDGVAKTLALEILLPDIILPSSLSFTPAKEEFVFALFTTVNF